MKFYLAGPMTGLPDHNYPAFHAAASALRARSLDVINPAELHPNMPMLIATLTPLGAWQHCMIVDIPQLLTCQAIILLPNWIQSRGARLEVAIGIALGLTFIDYASWKALSPWRLSLQLALRTLLTPAPETDVLPALPAPQRKEAA